MALTDAGGAPSFVLDVPNVAHEANAPPRSLVNGLAEEDGAAVLEVVVAV